MSDEALPAGRLLTWYGDDFTGSAAVLEVLAFAGISSVLFLDLPNPGDLQDFDACAAIGIAGVARARSPAWMDRHLPPVFEALARLNAPIAHYKICSTLDSSPEIGSIGRAVRLAEPILGGEWHPLMVASLDLGRYQAFGNLFANAGGVTYRLDRHPVMSRHPITPMDEADVRRHLARQTSAPIGLVDLPALRSPDSAQAALRDCLAAGQRLVALDAMDPADVEIAGQLIWENRGARLLAVGSQGIEGALIAHWRRAGLLPEVLSVLEVAPVERIVVVSGSVSELSAQQIRWGLEHGFASVALDAAGLLTETSRRAVIDGALASAEQALDAGASVIVHTAEGPDDPAVAAFRSAVAKSGVSFVEANALIGEALGDILDGLLEQSGIDRAVVAGGDTSGHATAQLGVYALTALAPLAPGAGLSTAHRRGRPPIELVLKGGQMGPPDFYGWVRDGYRPAASHP